MPLTTVHYSAGAETVGPSTQGYTIRPAGAGSFTNDQQPHDKTKQWWATAVSTDGSMFSPRFHKSMRGLFIALSGIVVVSFLLLTTWGIGSLPAADRHMARLHASGILDHTPFIDANGSLSFMRYDRSPVGRFLHVLPTGLWSFIAPFMVNVGFRNKHRALHRRMGRVFIGMSVAIAVGIPFLIYQRASKVHYGFVHGAAMMAVAAYFLVTALMAIHYARQKRYDLHRKWIIRHLAVGYSAHVLRLLSVSQVFLHHIVPTYREHSQAGSDIRSLVFAAYFWTGALISLSGGEVWLYCTSTSRMATMYQPTKDKNLDTAVGNSSSNSSSNKAL